jgi:hypothetical protein
MHQNTTFGIMPPGAREKWMDESTVPDDVRAEVDSARRSCLRPRKSVTLDPSGSIAFGPLCSTFAHRLIQ